MKAQWLFWNVWNLARDLVIDSNFSERNSGYSEFVFVYSISNMIVTIFFKQINIFANLYHTSRLTRDFVSK